MEQSTRLRECELLSGKFTAKFDQLVVNKERNTNCVDRTVQLARRQGIPVESGVTSSSQSRFHKHILKMSFLVRPVANDGTK